MRRSSFRFALLGAALMLVVAGHAASDPGSTPVSKYAPAKDLIAQINYFVGRLDESLAAAADYDEAKQSRVLKDASTLAALGLLLGMHDDEHSLKTSAADLIDAAAKLAADRANYDAAKADADKLKQALAGRGTSSRKLQWEKVAELPPLMKQTPLVNSSLKRSVGARFAKQTEQIAGQAATLAAIAQASIFMPPTTAVGDAAKWQKYCEDMRDAAGAVNQAAHAGAAADAASAMKRLGQSCEACHEVFRREAK